MANACAYPLPHALLPRLHFWKGQSAALARSRPLARSLSSPRFARHTRRAPPPWLEQQAPYCCSCPRRAHSQSLAHSPLLLLAMLSSSVVLYITRARQSASAMDKLNRAPHLTLLMPPLHPSSALSIHLASHPVSRCHLSALPRLCSEAGAATARHGQGLWLQPLVAEPP
jgi:hypothetical protein